MIITRATDYTVRALLHLAERYPARVVSKAELCRAAGVTPAFLTKILQPLVHAGLVRSKRGVKGGFALARDPETLTVLDVMRAAGEPLALSPCLDKPGACVPAAPSCPVRDLWHEARRELEEIFARRSLADLTREATRRRAGSGPCTDVRSRSSGIISLDSSRSSQ